MRIAKSSLAFLILLSVLFLPGCYDSSYYFNFQAEGNLANEEGEWLTDAGIFGIGDDGLFLDDSWITAPLEFAGDFSFEVNFWFKATSEFPGNIKIGISDRPWREDPGQYAWFWLTEIGSASEYLRAGENGADGIHYFGPFDFTSLKRSDWNELLVEKSGSHFSLKVNGRRVYEFDIINCSSDYFAVNFRMDTNSIEDPGEPEYGGKIKDVSIRYKKGNARLITIP